MTKQPFDIYAYLSENLDPPRTYGLQALIYIALREHTSLAYQHKELNFSDIALEIVSHVDEMPEDEQLYLAAQIADDLFEYFAFLPLADKKKCDRAEYQNAIA